MLGPAGRSGLKVETRAFGCSCAGHVLHALWPALFSSFPRAPRPYFVQKSNVVLPQPKPLAGAILCAIGGRLDRTFRNSLRVVTSRCRIIGRRSSATEPISCPKSGRYSVQDSDSRTAPGWTRPKRCITENSVGFSDAECTHQNPLEDPVNSPQLPPSL